MSWASKVRSKPKSKPEAGEIVGEEYDEETRSIWEKHIVLLSLGALWGDVECYAFEDIVVKKRVKENVVVKPFDCDNCSQACEVIMKKKGLGNVCLTCFDTYQSPPEPVVIKKQKCKGCSFHVHSTPPDDFTPEQRMFCCSICQSSKGRKHGGRCEQGAC